MANSRALKPYFSFSIQLVHVWGISHVARSIFFKRPADEASVVCVSVHQVEPDQYLIHIVYYQIRSTESVADPPVDIIARDLSFSILSCPAISKLKIQKDPIPRSGIHSFATAFPALLGLKKIGLAERFTKSAYFASNGNARFEDDVVTAAEVGSIAIYVKIKG